MLLVLLRLVGLVVAGRALEPAHFTRLPKDVEMTYTFCCLSFFGFRIIKITDSFHYGWVRLVFYGDAKIGYNFHDLFVFRILRVRFCCCFLDQRPESCFFRRLFLRIFPRILHLLLCWWPCSWKVKDEKYGN